MDVSFQEERINHLSQDGLLYHCRHCAALIALRYGLSRTEAEDCADTFCVHLLQYRLSPSCPPSAVLRRSAENWVRNFLRAKRRREKHEIQWSVHPNKNGTSVLLDVPAQEEGIEAREIRQELLAILLEAVGALPSSSKRLFVERYLKNRSIEELSHETGRTQQALRKSLQRACLRLRGILERRGFNEAELRNYIAIMSSPPLV